MKKKVPTERELFSSSTAAALSPLLFRGKNNWTRRRGEHKKDQKGTKKIIGATNFSLLVNCIHKY